MGTTWRALTTFADVVGLRAFAWGDLDRDGDPDAALLDADGNLHLFANQQAGQFRRWQLPDEVSRLVANHGCRRERGWTTRPRGAGGRRRGLAHLGRSRRLGPRSDRRVAGSAGRLLMADLDNNGALDLVASGVSRTAIWLADERITLRPFPAALEAEVFAIIDGDGDGRLDLIGLSDGRPLWLRGRGTRDYHWQVVRPRAQRAAGDQRINSFGVGGEIVRSVIEGNPWLADVAPITGPMYQLFIFFMITDPKTTVAPRSAQCVVVFVVALVEAALRLGEVVYEKWTPKSGQRLK